MSLSDTIYEPTLIARKSKLADPKRTGQPTLSNIPPLSTNKLTSPVQLEVVQETASPVQIVQETADNSPPPSYSLSEKAARYEALRQQAQAARAASSSTNFSGSIISAGGKLTIKTTATERIIENVNKSYFSADKGIEESREAPNIDLTHKEVTFTTLETFKSRTKATENATLNMTDTETTAAENIEIDQQATKILKVTETKALTLAANKIKIVRDATHIEVSVDGQPLAQPDT